MKYDHNHRAMDMFSTHSFLLCLVGWFSVHFFYFSYLKFVSKYIWRLAWRGSLAHAMRTVNTHLSSYLFVFYISWFDTTLTLTLTSKYYYPFIRAVAQWARASEWETERLWYAPHLVAKHTAVAPFARHIHTSVYINTVDRNEREFTSDCHAWACCCVAKINEWKLRYTTVCDCIFAY